MDRRKLLRTPDPCMSPPMHSVSSDRRAPGKYHHVGSQIQRADTSMSYRFYALKSSDNAPPSWHIQRVLTDCGGNVSQAAKLLGLHRRSLQRKLFK